VNRFRFRLERVERLRKVRRGDAKAALVAALADARAAEGLRCALEVRWEQARAAGPDLSAGCDGRRIREHALWVETTRDAAAAAAHDEVAAFDAARACDALHTEAAREHRVIERLRDRRRRAWEEAAAVEEQKFLDEIHLLRRARGVEREESRR
jgi:flagellar biosynthesis chaperone FliJ